MVDVKAYKKRVPVKIIRVRVYSAYSKSRTPWYVTKELMSKSQFDDAVKDWKVVEFEDRDSWRTDTEESFSWVKGFINKLHD